MICHLNPPPGDSQPLGPPSHREDDPHWPCPTSPEHHRAPLADLCWGLVQLRAPHPKCLRRPTCGCPLLASHPRRGRPVRPKARLVVGPPPGGRPHRSSAFAPPSPAGRRGWHAPGLHRCNPLGGSACAPPWSASSAARVCRRGPSRRCICPPCAWLHAPASLC